MVSVIVPYIDGGLPVIKRLVPSLFRATKAFKNPVQVIFCGVSSDGTTQGLKSLARQFKDPLFEIDVRINKSKDTSYGGNVNFGCKFAKFEFLLIVNNDIVVPENFFLAMTYSFNYLWTAYKKGYCVIQPGALGPLSNRVMGHQMVQIKGLDSQMDHDVEKATERVNEMLRSQNRQPVFASFISGFCLFTTKQIFEGLGGFDSRLQNGNEDVDFCLRLVTKGFGSFVVPSVFVFHEGSHTMRTLGLNKKLDNGTWNRHILAKIHWPKRKKFRVGCGLRVKADESELKFWFDRNFDLYDCIFVVDDGCEVNWKGLEEHYRQKNPKFRLQVNGALKGETEVVQRVSYTSMAYQDGVDALVNLDHDEIFEPKVTRETFQRLLNMPLPGAIGFSGPMLHLWNSENLYRVGYPPTRHTFMTRLVGGIRHFSSSQDDATFHCSRLPTVPVVGSAPTGVRVLHYGYISPELRRKKREWYESKDHVKNPYLIGNVDYSHMVDERMMRVNEWTGKSEDYSIALNTMFDNEKPHQLQIFFENFASVADKIFARTGDTSSELCEVAKRFGAKVFEKKWTNDYSEARNFLLSKCREKFGYVWFMDPDERYSDPQEMIDLVMARPTAIMFSFNNFHPKLGTSFSESTRLFVNDPRLKFEGRVHESVEFALKKLSKKEQVLILRANKPADHYGFLWSNLDKKLMGYEKLNEKAIAENPDDCRPYYNLALHKLEGGALGEAIELLTKACELEPKFALAKIELAKTYLFSAYCLIDSCASHVPSGHPLFKTISNMSNVLQNSVPVFYFRWIERKELPKAFQRFSKSQDLLYDVKARLGEVFPLVDIEDIK